MEKTAASAKAAALEGRGLRLPSTFRALRHYNYRLWFFGQGISLIGTWMDSMAQQVLIYQLTGSAASLGMISFIALIPLLPLTIWGGSISDRFPKRTVLLFTQSALTIEAMVLAILCLTGVVQIWHVYLMALLLGATNAIDLPARQAFTVDMVEGKEDLTNAIGLNSAMFNGARAIGPALAGIVVAATGVGNAFLINSLSFLAVIYSLLKMRNLPQSSHAIENGSTVEHMKEGYRYIIKQRVILMLVSLIGVSAFLSMPYSTLMPVFADVVLKNSAAPVVSALCTGKLMALQCQTPEALPLGLLMTSVGIGAVIGALVVASLSDTARRGIMLTIGNLCFPLALLVFALSRSFTLSMLILVVIGFSFVWQNALANTLLQLIVSDEVRGRVMAFYTMTFQGFMRLGGLQAGYMADWLSAPRSVGIGAAISLLYGLGVAVFYPKLRRLR
jgi:MFS family permease